MGGISPSPKSRTDHSPQNAQKVMTILLLFIIAAHAIDWAVEFSGQHSVKEFAQAHGLIYTHHIVEGIHLFHLPHPTKSLQYLRLWALHRAIKSTPLPFVSRVYEIEGNNDQNIITNEFNVTWMKEQVPLQIEKKRNHAMPFPDPLLPEQWHLHNTTEYHHVHMNVFEVWKMNITGKGSVIAIVDDGVQHRHPDLRPNWLPGINNWNFVQNSPETTPQNLRLDWHGTAVAGLAVAAGDGEECGVGVSPDAKYSAIVLLQETNTFQKLTDALIAKAISHRLDINDIFCNSWGPKDDGLRKEGPHELTLRTLHKAIQEGRNGKGSLYMWAAGNGRGQSDNCNYDGYANSRFVITIGAVNENGKATDYSEPCCAQIGVLPSGGRRGLRTTDLLGGDGGNRMPGRFGNCNTNFGGTSVTAPLAAGIAALVLEANPNITWLDFQYIIKSSTLKNDPLHHSWRLNGAGNWVSHDYGFGLIDAYNAVKIAKMWKKSIREISASYSSVVNRKFAQIGFASDRIFVNTSFVLHHVEVIFTITHTFRGYLGVRLVSPAGTKSIFAEAHNDPNPNYENWRVVSLFNWGERSYGNWTLGVYSEKYPRHDNNTVFVEWTLRLYGVANDTDTSQFSTGIVEWEVTADPQLQQEEDARYFKTIMLGVLLVGIFLIVSVAVSKTIINNIITKEEPTNCSEEESSSSQKAFIIEGQEPPDPEPDDPELKSVQTVPQRENL